jgi:hypothetical protein
LALAARASNGYRLHAGVLEKSNALSLELMRPAGLEV